MRYASISTATSNLQACTVKDVTSLYSKRLPDGRAEKMGSVAYRLALFYSLDVTANGLEWKRAVEVLSTMPIPYGLDLARPTRGRNSAAFTCSLSADTICLW